MNITIVFMLTTIMLFSRDCQQKGLKIESLKKEVTSESDKNALNNLDRILSPFEDMTEYALDKNGKGILISFGKVEREIKNSTFEKNLSTAAVKLFNVKIAQLEKMVKQNNYKQIALTSTEIFEYNVSNFKEAKKIKNQISIEHLDYMGFKILALLIQKNIDWKVSEQTISNVKKTWIALRSKVHDSNLKSSFDYLFKGIQLSIKNRDRKMSEILALMDLSLVDVLEKNI